MKTQTLVFVVIGFLLSCTNTQDPKADTLPNINYSDTTELIELLKGAPASTATIYLCFWMGMTKTEYLAHIEKLQSGGGGVLEAGAIQHTGGLYYLETPF